MARSFGGKTNKYDFIEMENRELSITSSDLLIFLFPGYDDLCVMKKQEKYVGRSAGKVAIVTGGARGIGAAHVRILIETGAKVVITDILEKEGQALAKEYSESAIFLLHDVRNKEQWVHVVEIAEKRFGKVTTLVNNAGIIDGGPMETFS